MSLQQFLANPESLRLPLLVLAAVCLVAALLIYLKRRERAGKIAARAAADGLEFQSTAPPGLPGALFRGLLWALAAVVAGGFLLLVLPHGAFDGMVGAIAMRTAPPPPSERIAFLYLGDAVKEKELHIRGAIRNITTQPIQSLDAAIRLYAADRTLLETTIVRMDAEAIPPDAVATFHLAFSDYQGQFASYSVDFKLRSGELVTYKDMRGSRPRE